MIQGKEKVFEWLKLNQTPYWKLKDQRGTDLKAISPGVDDLSLDDSIEHLSKIFDTLGEGYYTLEAWKTKGQTKEWKRELVRIGDAAGQVAAIGSLGAAAAISQTDIDERVNKAMEDYKRALKIEQLEARVKELEAINKELELEMDSFDKRIYNRVSPFIGALYKGLGIDPGLSQEAISGQSEQTVEEIEKRLEAAFEKWEKHEKDTVTLLEKIAQLAETDTSTYNVARNMLMSQQ